MIQKLNIYFSVHLQRNFVLFFLFFVSVSVFAAPSKTVYSIVAGASWTNSSHWSYTSGGAPCSCIPDASKDIIYIETNTSSEDGLIFGASVTLVVRNNFILTVNGNTQFMNGSDITVQSGNSMIINGNLTNNNNSNQVVIDGTLTVNGNFTGNNGSTITGTGSMSTTGSATTVGTGKVFGSEGDCATGPCYASSSSPLPVSLLSFTAVCDNTSVVLKWSTASEINNHFFQIDKCNNGLDFQYLAKIPGAGTSNRILNYTHTDNHLQEGTFYYRLKQVDFDGKSEYLDIKAISYYNHEPACDIFIKPNPCIGRCVISFENCNEEEFQDARFMIFDALGNAVYTSPTKQIMNGQAQFDVDVSSNLKPAVYFIRGNANSKIRSKKIIINK